MDFEVLYLYLRHSPGILGTLLMEFEVLSRLLKHSSGILGAVLKLQITSRPLRYSLNIFLEGLNKDAK